MLQEYTGTVPAEDIQRLFKLGESATEFDVVYGIEPESGERIRYQRVTGLDERRAGLGPYFTIDGDTEMAAVILGAALARA